VEKTPFQPGSKRHESRATVGVATADVSPDWRKGLPAFKLATCTLREVHREDAASLMAHLSTEDVSRFILPPPHSVEGFESYIAKARRDREVGQYACFAVVPDGMDSAVGVFQLRQLEAGFATAEWGFAMGSAFWGAGLFIQCAKQVLEFAFDTVGVQRLEARAAVMNGRGNGALRKIGAVQEGVLRRSFKRHGQFFDQVLWSVLAEDWRLQRSARRGRVH
jgi:[ribosomal protein S5]-alanine N-acetyltransferase